MHIECEANVTGTLCVTAYPVAGQPPAGYVPAPPPAAYGGKIFIIFNYALSMISQCCYKLVPLYLCLKNKYQIVIGM